MVRALIFLLFVIFTSGCNYNRLKSNQNEGNQQISQELAKKLSFAFVYNEVFSPKCVSCHGDGNKLNLQTYSTTIVKLAEIENSVFVTQTMPKQGSLTEEQKLILKGWIQAGAPEFPASPVDPPPNETLEPKFASIDRNIFQNRCVVCHSPGNSAKHILLTHQELLDSPRELVLPGNPDESLLVIAIERDNDKRMPPAKEGYSKLKEDEILAIRKWILNGAQD